jgi:hypothetical protein
VPVTSTPLPDGSKDEGAPGAPKVARSDMLDIREFGVEKTVDWGVPLLKALKASPGYALLNFPYLPSGYTVNALQSADALLYPKHNTLKN